MKMRTILIIIGAVVLIAGIALYFIIPKPEAVSEKKEVSAENNPFGFAGPAAPVLVNIILVLWINRENSTNMA